MSGRGLSIVAASILLGLSARGQGNDPAVSERIDPPLEKLFSLDMSPGMSVAVVRGTDLVYARGFGHADLSRHASVTPETFFYIASTTKSLTAFACALLEDQGTVSFREPVQHYVPGLMFHPDIDPSTITLESLLTHTHGLEGIGPVVIRTAFTGDYTYEQLLHLTARHGPARGGRTFRYSNIGYNIAGFVLREVAGTTWKEAVGRLVLGPMGMTDTRADVSALDPARTAVPYEATPDGFSEARPQKNDATMHAAGGHYTTALDMAAWIGVHLNGGVWNGRRVFPDDVIDATHRQWVEQDREFGPIHRYGWGLGWDLGTYENDTLVHRFGSYAGFRSHVSFMPSRKLGVVVLVNEASLGSDLADAAAFTIYDALEGTTEANDRVNAMFVASQKRAPEVRKKIAEDLATRRTRQRELPRALTSYTGTYVNDDYGTMEVTVEDGNLVFSFGNLRSEAEVYDASEEAFRVELTGGGEVIRTTILDDKARSLTFHGIRFDRTD